MDPIKDTELNAIYILDHLDSNCLKTTDLHSYVISLEFYTHFLKDIPATFNILSVFLDFQRAGETTSLPAYLHKKSHQVFTMSQESSFGLLVMHLFHKCCQIKETDAKKYFFEREYVHLPPQQTKKNLTESLSLSHKSFCNKALSMYSKISLDSIEKK